MYANLCLCILIVTFMYSNLCLCILIVTFMYSNLCLCILIVTFMYSHCYVYSVLCILFSSCQLALFVYPD
jgi:hypothetical protein